MFFSISFGFFLLFIGCDCCFVLFPVFSFLITINTMLNSQLLFEIWFFPTLSFIFPCENCVCVNFDGKNFNIFLFFWWNGISFKSNQTEVGKCIILELIIGRIRHSMEKDTGLITIWTNYPSYGKPIRDSMTITTANFQKCWTWNESDNVTNEIKIFFRQSKI